MKFINLIRNNHTNKDKSEPVHFLHDSLDILLNVILKP